jgi:hypothetical protein
MGREVSKRDAGMTPERPLSATERPSPADSDVMGGPDGPQSAATDVMSSGGRPEPPEADVMKPR